MTGPCEAQPENSEVLPAASVAVAVRTGPAKFGKLELIVEMPTAFVTTVANPIKLCPSPNPDESHELFEKKLHAKCGIWRADKLAGDLAKTDIIARVREHRIILQRIGAIIRVLRMIGGHSIITEIDPPAKI